MKVNFSQLLAILILALTISVVNSASGQEGAPINETPEFYPPISTDSNTREEKPLLYEPEGKTINKEQILPVPSQSKVKGKNTEPTKSTASKTDEALSFNFLYYIIQKYKISDIVDQ